MYVPKSFASDAQPNFLAYTPYVTAIVIETPTNQHVYTEAKTNALPTLNSVFFQVYTPLKYNTDVHIHVFLLFLFIFSKYIHARITYARLYTFYKIELFG